MSMIRLIDTFCPVANRAILMKRMLHVHRAEQAASAAKIVFLESNGSTSYRSTGVDANLCENPFVGNRRGENENRRSLPEAICGDLMDLRGDDLLSQVWELLVVGPMFERRCFVGVF